MDKKPSSTTDLDRRGLLKSGGMAIPMLAAAGLCLATTTIPARADGNCACGGNCSGVCKEDCSGGCTKGCGSFCGSGCEGGCNDTCYGGCAGDCGGTCKDGCRSSSGN